MQLPNIQNVDVKGKRVLLRADLDVPLSGAAIEDDSRLVASLETIQFLLDKGATVIVAGHLGRPTGIDKSLSLEPVAKWFSQKSFVTSQQLVATKVGELDGWKLADNLYVLENLRFNEGEKKNDPVFAQKLASVADIYVNDAFSVCHRMHASTVGVAALLPHYCGLHLAKEVDILGGVLENPKRPLVVIIGGAKVETKMPLITKMQNFADFVLVGGKLPQEDVVRNIVSEKVVVAKLTVDANDITPESVDEFKKVIANAGEIIWNGPLGLIKDDIVDTERGTREVATIIAQSSAYKIVGGGDTVDYLRQAKLIDTFDFVSMGGGAMLAFLSGEKLPGLEALVG